MAAPGSGSGQPEPQAESEPKTEISRSPSSQPSRAEWSQAKPIRGDPNAKLQLAEPRAEPDFEQSRAEPCAKLSRVNQYRSTSTVIHNDPQWKSKEARNLNIPAENVLPRPALPTLQSPITASAGPILLKFWLKTQKSILNKVTKFQIPVSNRLGAIIEKQPGVRICPRKK